MKFFDKLYVGLSDRGQDHTQLGFAIGYDPGKAAFEKQKKTVDQWARGYRRKVTSDPIIVDNKPRHGFKFTDTVSRWSTSNKLFRIQDPLGFDLEVPVDNVLDIIQNNTVVNGEIMGPMVWGKYKQMYLYSEKSKEYQEHVKGPVEFELKPGMILRNKVGNLAYKYLGSFNSSIYSFDTKCLGIPDRWGTGYYNRTKVKATGVHTVCTRKDRKTRDHVYATYVLKDEAYEKGYRDLEVRTKPIPDLIPADVELPDDYELTRGEIYDRSKMTTEIGRYTDMFMFFDTVQDRKDHEDDIEELKKLAQDDRPTNSYYVDYEDAPRTFELKGSNK